MSAHQNTKTNNARLPKGGRWLGFDQAVLLLHRKDTCMAKMHSPVGPHWFVLPGGGYVKPEDAEKILKRPDIRGQKDALFPGLDQTYRMVR
jgi:hypothetical protein